MAINYTKLQAKVLAMLQSNGQTITFGYSSGESGSVATGDQSGGTPATLEGRGVVSRYKNNEINGETVLSSDGKLICNNVSAEPQIGWTVIANGRTFRVMDVNPINPAGTNVAYICQIRI